MHGLESSTVNTEVSKERLGRRFNVPEICDMFDSSVQRFVELAVWKPAYRNEA